MNFVLINKTRIWSKSIWYLKVNQLKRKLNIELLKTWNYFFGAQQRTTNTKSNRNSTKEKFVLITSYVMLCWHFVHDKNVQLKYRWQSKKLIIVCPKIQTNEINDNEISVVCYCHCVTRIMIHWASQRMTTQIIIIISCDPLFLLNFIRFHLIFLIFPLEKIVFNYDLLIQNN